MKKLLSQAGREELIKVIGPIHTCVHQVRDDWLKREFVKSVSPIWKAIEKAKY